MLLTLDLAAPAPGGWSWRPRLRLRGFDPGSPQDLPPADRNDLTLAALRCGHRVAAPATSRRASDETARRVGHAARTMNRVPHEGPPATRHEPGGEGAGFGDADEALGIDHADTLDDVDAHADVPDLDDTWVAAPAIQAAAGSADDSALCAWIAAIVDHDERALAALYRATFARVHALVLRITQRAALAEEAVEDTYWQVWRQAPRFDAARGRALTWLLAMARSRAIDALRRDQRFRHDELPEDDEAGALAEAVQAAPPDLLQATRAGSALHAALERLEPQPRQLVALAFLRGLTHEEIADQTALPLGTVKSQIRRALITLKGLLGDAAGPDALP